MFHYAAFDEERAAGILADAGATQRLVKLARKRCFADGSALKAPDAYFTVLGGLDASASPQALLHLVHHTSQSVANSLVARRNYTDLRYPITRGFNASKHHLRMSCHNSTKEFDPRFLCFEFMAGFMLRKRQVARNAYSARVER